MADDPDPGTIRDHIIEAALPDITFDGWTWNVIEAAAGKAGYGPEMAHAVFPGQLGSALSHFSAWADRGMLRALEDVDIEPMRVRDRIRLAVMTRIEVLGPHKEAVRLALAYWSMPTRGFGAGKMVWRTADHIWNWAGDVATDYNHYTKRGLLAGVLSSVMLAWMNDDSGNPEVTQEFLDRRIENVMQFGRFLGKIRRSG